MAPDLHKQARPEGLEPPTLGLEVRRSIHLSYGRRCCDHSPGPVPGSGRRAVTSLHPRRNAALSAGIATAPLRRYRWAGAKYLRLQPPDAKTGPIRIMDVSGPSQTPAGLEAGTPVVDLAQQHPQPQPHRHRPSKAPVCAARPASGRCPRRRGAGPSTRGMALRCSACVRGRRPAAARPRQERSEHRTGPPHRRRGTRPQRRAQRPPGWAWWGPGWAWWGPEKDWRSHRWAPGWTARGR